MSLRKQRFEKLWAKEMRADETRTDETRAEKE
jgi:hypothetical protein